MHSFTAIVLVVVFSHCLAANHPECGKNGPKRFPKIVGGENAVPGEFPWQGSLRRFSSSNGWYHTCGCALLNEEWVLTAAHCVDSSSDPNNYKVRLGEHDFSKNEGTEVELDAAKVIKHENYDSKQINNDVAVIKLKKKVQLSERIGPICIPDKEDLDQVLKHNPCIASGWGRLEYNGKLPDILQKVKVDVVQQSTCKNTYMLVHPIQPGMICFGEQNKGVCNGDSGGPLNCQRKEDGRWYNYGSHSFVVECNKRHYPSVAARNSEYAQWIWDKVENN